MSERSPKEAKMQFYPQHYFGFAIDDGIAQKLNLAEAYNNYETNFDENDFFDGFEDSFGVEPYNLADTTYSRGGYIQSLTGFEWDQIYVCFHPATVGDERWSTMVSKLEDLGVTVTEGRWSQLG